MSDLILKWEDPPTASGRWAAVARALSDYPGEWALVGEDLPRTTAWESARRRLQARGCEVRVRKMVDGYSVWARFIPVEE